MEIDTQMDKIKKGVFSDPELRMGSKLHQTPQPIAQIKYMTPQSKRLSGDRSPFRMFQWCWDLDSLENYH